MLRLHGGVYTVDWKIAPVVSESYALLKISAYYIKLLSKYHMFFIKYRFFVNPRSENQFRYLMNENIISRNTEGTGHY